MKENKQYTKEEIKAIIDKIYESYEDPTKGLTQEEKKEFYRLLQDHYEILSLNYTKRLKEEGKELKIYLPRLKDGIITWKTTKNAGQGD